MAITNLVRDYGVEPSIVRMASTDNYETISAPGYITAQYNNILLVNSGDFSWDPSDVVLCWYQTDAGVSAWAFFSINSTFTSLNPFVETGSNTITLSQAQVLLAYATPQLLIPAPGAGNAIVLNKVLVVTEVSTQFSGGGSGVVQYGTTVHGAGTNALSATIPAVEITAAASQIYTVNGYVNGIVTTGITNVGVYFSNQTAAFAGGAGSTVAFVLDYSVVAATV